VVRSTERSWKHDDVSIARAAHVELDGRLRIARRRQDRRQRGLGRLAAPPRCAKMIGRRTSAERNRRLLPPRRRAPERHRPQDGGPAPNRIQVSRTV
jgi:hypothetical protein